MADSFDDWTKWSKKDLLYFPTLQPYLKQEKKHQKDKYLNLLDEYRERKQLEDDFKIKRLDRDMNLNRILSYDQKYISLGRNKPKNNFFDSSIMTRILTDATKTVKKRNKFTNSIESFSINFPIEAPCARFVRNTKRFDDREYFKYMSLSNIDVFNENSEQDMQTEHSNIENILIDKQINQNEQKFGTELKSDSSILPKIDLKKNIHEHNNTINSSINTTTTTNNNNNNEKKTVSLPMIKQHHKPVLKPKYQLAGFEFRNI